MLGFLLAVAGLVVVVAVWFGGAMAFSRLFPTQADAEDYEDTGAYK